ncbi:XdhC family protein [Ahniella affigens]|uniref:XdhC family protein n=1 Tax=Ahniella affigens TaxID=2021234 RepID=UPI001F0CDC3F|nr:XdhC/CoxI family protein [Ahniella affigens]
MPRHRGAMLWCQIGATSAQMHGSVGGGLLEATVLQRAHALLAAELDADAVAIDLSGKPESAGICGGQVHVRLKRWQGPSAGARAAALAAALAAGQTVQLLPNEFGADDLAAPLTIAPEPMLLICGAGHCGQALALQAQLIGFRLAVQDSRADMLAHAAYASATILHGDASVLRNISAQRPLYAVLLNRDWASDLACLNVLAEMPPDYVGMMGSRRRVAAVRSALPDLDRCLPLLDAPLGLELGAETPEEIAISILARLIQHRRLNRPHSPP